MRKLTLLVLVALLATAALGLAAGPAAAKDFAIRNVTIEAQVRPNGDLRVRESRTLEFDGDFSYVYWDLDATGSDGIEVLGASGPGGPYSYTDDWAARPPDTYHWSTTGDRVNVQLFFRLSDTTATFTVEYVARGAADRWNDTAELYWKFIGDETAKPCDDVRVTVTLPEGVTQDQVRAWAHGPLWGEVRITPRAQVVMTVSPLPEYTYVEGRILFPATALAKLRSEGSARLDQVLAVEGQLADEANRQRLVARILRGLWAVVGVGAPLAALVLAIVLYRRYGREPKTQFQAQYLRDVPQPRLPPALAGYIWRMGSVTDDDAVATLLDFIDRGVVTIARETVEDPKLFGADEKTTYRLTLQQERLGEVEVFEQDLARFLFLEMADDGSFTMEELRDIAKAQRTEFSSGYRVWKKSVEEEGKARGFLDARADRMAFWAATAGFVAAVAAGAAAIFSQFYWYFIGVAVSVAVVFVARSVKRRSAEAAELHAQYSALERYLEDFGRLQEKPPDAVVLWEQFLVYATVFGIADQVMKDMQVKVPEVVQDQGFRTMGYLMIVPPGESHSPFSSLHSGFSAAVAASTASSSSGGGGGFSGGGGGGGGGGGFGAG